eukprot:CAMPEP_0197232600 /NCGR_PEP_ID=MMETSP1429-20130617/863_1 /TAXON_ID=49237 /ORGANISM="Chaetoceros  sp., Strain UNC1202" /LENGTH=278 /DNA_ID=CAMNT_0042690673 /DNA_START=86 /DNA_END=918 /DNA_ORIENTATION=-
MSDQDKEMIATEETNDSTTTPNSAAAAPPAPEETTDADANEDNVADEEDLEKLQAEIAKMEEEAARIAAETASLEKKDEENEAGTGAEGSGAGGGKKEGTNGSTGGNAGAGKDAADKASVDRLSIYVGQVDYSATPEELLAHFEPCGTVERVTINCDKFTGRPKGFAYLEFETEDAANNAVKLDGSTFKGRTLKVTHKRVNTPFFYHNQPAGRGGGRGFGGRGSHGGGYDHEHGPPHSGGRGRGPPQFGGRGPPFRGGPGGRMPFRGGPGGRMPFRGG